jgi:hypothetical protein
MSLEIKAFLYHVDVWQFLPLAHRFLSVLPRDRRSGASARMQGRRIADGRRLRISAARTPRPKRHLRAALGINSFAENRDESQIRAIESRPRPDR